MDVSREATPYTHFLIHKYTRKKDTHNQVSVLYFCVQLYNNFKRMKDFLQHLFFPL